ncbi:MAG: Ig-like domain-containing protein [Phycisphaerae bacterium]|nr:Ig-like domain-containing protein [Gemmatimonadaceae bacterium]
MTEVLLTPSGVQQIFVGGSLTLSATARGKGGVTIRDRRTNWSSSNQSVATVNDDGRVSAISPGSADISAAVDDVKATVPVTVNSPSPVTATVSIVPGGPQQLAVGSTAALQAVARTLSGIEVTGRVTTWTTSNSSVATVSGNGIVTAVAVGSANISATVDGVNALVPMTVIAASPVLASVTITPGGPQNLSIGATVTLVATARSANGSVITGRPVTWISSNPVTAAVSSGGIVIAIAAGTANIIATIDGVSGSSAFVVSAVVVPVLEVVSGNNQSGIVGRAYAESLTVRARTSNGTPLPNVPIAWASSGGAISSSATATNANGLSRVQWMASTGSGVVTASASRAVPVSFTGNAKANGACSLAPSAATARFSLGATDFTLSLRSTSPLRIAVLFVDFPGLPASETPASLMSSVVDPGVALLQELSHNRLNITTVAFPKWYRMSKSIEQYDWTTFLGHRVYIDEAMTVADADINFANFDAVYIFAPPSTNKVISPTFNGGSSSAVIHDGRNFGNAVTFGLDSRSYGPSVVVHETGHMLGLVDLYTFDASGSPFMGNQFRYIGAWSLMSNIFNAAHWLTWEKRKLGFIDPAQFDCLEGTVGEEVVIQPNASNSTGVKGVGVKLDASRALVIEVRDRQGLDANLCSSGVLIYEVNASSVSGFGPAAVRGSRVTTFGPQFNKCGPWADATYGVGAGAIDTFTDAASGTIVKVLAAESNGAYRVRITR